MARSPGIIGLAAAALFQLACGAANPSAPNSATGTATFSGAVTGSLSGVVVVIEAPSGQSPNLVFSGSGAGITFQQEIGLGGAALAAGVYTSANTSVASGTIAFDSQTYGEIGGGSAGTDAVGTFSLDITSAGTPQTSAGDTVYLGVHGTLTATYDLNQTAGSTPASVSVTF